MAEPLEAAWATAYISNPELEAQRAALRATDEGVAQARGGWHPQVEANITAGYSRSSLGNSRVNTRPFIAELSVNQPVYTGGRVSAQIGQAEALVQQGRANLSATEQGVLLDVVTAYMNVLRDQEVVDLNENNIVVLRRQLEASQDRFDVGEATVTDVAQSEARVARAISDLTSAQGALQSSRANYERVVGRMPGELVPPPPLPIGPATEDEAVAIALSQNPALRAARYAEAAAARNIEIQKSQLRPTVDVEASVSNGDDSLSSNAESESFQVLGRVRVPLYQRGNVYSQVREAEQIRSQRNLETRDIGRQVEEQVSVAWSNLETARATITSSEEQVRASEIALDGVQQELLVGARTQLDVLDAEQELLNARVALVRAQRDEYVATFQLLSAVGNLTADGLGLSVDPYDPARNYDAVRDKWFGYSASLKK